MRALIRSLSILYRIKKKPPRSGKLAQEWRIELHDERETSIKGASSGLGNIWRFRKWSLGWGLERRGSWEGTITQFVQEVQSFG